MHLGIAAFQVRLKFVDGGNFSKRIEDARIMPYKRVLGPQKCYGLILCPLKACKADGGELAFRIRLTSNDPKMLAVRLVVKWVKVRLARGMALATLLN
jgi:hypothetical protein